MTIAFANDNHFTFSLVFEEVLSSPCFLAPCAFLFYSKVCVSLVQDCMGLQSCETLMPVETKTCLALRAATDERLLQGAGDLLSKFPYSRSFHPSAVPVGTAWLHFKRGNQSIPREKWEERTGAITVSNSVNLGTDCSDNQMHTHNTQSVVHAFTHAHV